MDAVKSKIFCVGLTGGIGSGKTTVANLFSTLHVPIVDADEISHQLTRKNEIGYEKIHSHFGSKILDDQKNINRKKLRDIIFNDAHEKKWLEDLLHPLIREAMKNKIAKINSPYCICVIPLLAESGGIDFINRVLVIDAPAEKQLSRAKQRDSTTNESIQKIIDSQADQKLRLKIADDVLKNDADLKSLENRVLQLHQQYLKLSEPKAQ